MLGTDLSNTHTTTQIRSPLALTADGNTSPIDLQNCDGPVTFYVSLGAVTGTSPTLDITVQGSINNASLDANGASDAYTAVSGVTVSQITDGDANTLTIVTVKSWSERYMRMNLDVGGTSPSFLLGVVATAQKAVL